MGTGRRRGPVPAHHGDTRREPARRGGCGAHSRRDSGRVLTTVALCAAYFFLLPYCWQGFSVPDSYGPAFAVMDIAAVLLSVVELHWLYHSNTSRYIHLMTVARQAG